jgi:hypothetical protein
MAMSIKTYSPTECSVIVGGAIITGFADGTFVKVTRDDDAFKKVVVADGEVSRSKSPNRGGSIEITLTQVSDSNAILGAMALIDDESGEGVVPVIVKDNLDYTAIGSKGWIKKLPDMERGKDMGNMTWTIDVAKFELQFPE